MSTLSSKALLPWVIMAWLSHITGDPSSINTLYGACHIKNQYVYDNQIYHHGSHHGKTTIGIHKIDNNWHIESQTKWQAFCRKHFQMHYIFINENYCILIKIQFWFIFILSGGSVNGLAPNLSGPFYKHGLTLIPARISNYIHYKVWDEITYPFLNFNGATVEV